MQSPSNIFVEQYKAAAAEGAVIELKLRLLADKIPSLQQYAHAQKLEDIEAEVAKHFGGSISEKEKETLALCLQLRNKVLHCNFRAARNKLEELGIEAGRGDVKKIDIAEMPPASMREKICQVITGDKKAFRYVADTSSTAPGSVFGWLLESGAAGDFNKAIDAFRDAVTIVDRLVCLKEKVSA